MAAMTMTLVMQVRSQDADTPLPGADPELANELDRLSERYLAELETRRMSATIREILEELLPTGAPTLEQVSRVLKRSPKSIQRRLLAEGVTFRDLQEQTRKSLALRYIRDPDIALSRIAQMLGFRIRATSIARSGANFRTHRLVKQGTQVNFSATTGAKSFALVFPLTGILILVFAFHELVSSGMRFTFAGGFLAAAGFVFLIAGVFLVREMFKPIVFDRSHGVFRLGWPPATVVRLTQIKGLQLIASASTGDSVHTNYELNLLLAGGTRQHGQHETLVTGDLHARQAVELVGQHQPVVRLVQVVVRRAAGAVLRRLVPGRGYAGLRRHVSPRLAREAVQHGLNASPGAVYVVDEQQRLVRVQVFQQVLQAVGRLATDMGDQLARRCVGRLLESCLSDKAGQGSIQGPFADVILQRIHDQAALVVENTRLFDDASNERSNLRLLFEIGQAVASSLSADEILNKTLALACEMMGARLGEACLYFPDEERLSLRSLYGKSIKYLEEFYETINKPRLVRREFMAACLTQ